MTGGSWSCPLRREGGGKVVRRFQFGSEVMGSWMKVVAMEMERGGRRRGLDVVDIGFGGDRMTEDDSFPFELGRSWGHFLRLGRTSFWHKVDNSW